MILNEVRQFERRENEREETIEVLNIEHRQEPISPVVFTAFGVVSFFWVIFHTVTQQMVRHLENEYFIYFVLKK